MKIYFNEKYFINPASELLILAPFVDEFKKDIRFEEIWNDDSNELTNIEDCDYVVMPYKWNKNNSNNSKVINEAIKHNKKVLIFHIDDSDEDINVDNSIVFRTSFYKSNQKEYEKAMPCFKIDTFKEEYIIDPKLSIGYCGQLITPIRKRIINELKNSNIKTDFILRTVAWPMIEPHKTKDGVMVEFYNNMENNIFNLCLRGGGNFSYRLYETLMMGRVPVIVNTDLVLPFDDIINWNEHVVMIEEGENIEDKIIQFYHNNDMNGIQKKNREFWEEYISPKGFIKNIGKIIV